ncbi:MAG TPA: putative sulfate exporter family transporter [Gemmatimonadaceae bacterium]|nr:putative sulfate exporter family transporter [Gemmatimonadaceae bacterium]
MASTVSPIVVSLTRRRRPTALIPGLFVSLVVSAIAIAGGALEERAFGRPIIEPRVLAILVGMAVRTVRGESALEAPGVRFVAKDLLELAVCLLGATMDVPRLFASGPLLAVGIVALVCSALGVGYVIGRAAGLSSKLAILVACGNAICGNSAIAAVAPVIGADREDVAASIALTAVLGVVVVLGLPLLIVPLGLSHYQYGVLAGLSVYAVPQVLAAAFAVSALSGQVATVVKLARVLMLGPVVVFFSLRSRKGSQGTTGLPRASLVPWFVIGFVVLATLRSFGVIPEPSAAIAKVVAGWLTVGAMAALGLSVDVRSVRRVGARVVIAVGGSLAALMLLAVGLIRLLAIR